MKKTILLFAILCFVLVGAFSQTGAITNVNASQRTDGSGLVDVYFDLSGSGNSYFMNLRVSFDAGTNYYPVSQNTISGSIGPLSPGSGKHIVWDPTQDYPNRYSPLTKLMLRAFTSESTNTCPGTPHVMDYDGNYYNTVQIGEQCWMRENLNVTHSPTGNNITRYCYDNILSNCDVYGGLYNWITMMNGSGGSNGNPSGVQGICPNGWHIPSDAEWFELTDYLINTYVDIQDGNVGNKLKSCRQIDSPLGGDCNTTEHPRWENGGSEYGTNDFVFSALPSGGGTHCYCWSSTEGGWGVWYRLLRHSDGYVTRNSGEKINVFIVRCVRD